MAVGAVRDFYEVLGVERTADAAEIKRAFRRLAHEYHPDKRPDDREAEERFKELARAYEVLIDQQLRLRYDRLGPEAFNGVSPPRRGTVVQSMGEVFTEIFGDIFAKRQGTTTRERGKDREVQVRIDFKTAVLGGERVIEVPRNQRCSDCRGTGARPGTAPSLCHACGGSGSIRVQQGVTSVSKRCAYCRGRGKIIPHPCGRCEGAGHVETRMGLRVRVPPATEDGTVLRYSGEGEPGVGGAASGDLRVTVTVTPDPVFKRDGFDLLCELPVTISEAALGLPVEVPTLDGRVRMRLPQGAQSGRVLRLRGKGIPNPEGEPGDQLVRITVETPQNLEEHERRLLEELDRTQREGSLPLRESFWRRVRNR